MQLNQKGMSALILLFAIVFLGSTVLVGGIVTPKGIFPDAQKETNMVMINPIAVSQNGLQLQSAIAVTPTPSPTPTPLPTAAPIRGLPPPPIIPTMPNQSSPPPAGQPTPTVAASVPSCIDDLRYCDNGRIIHKHGGVPNGNSCLYAFDDEGPCTVVIPTATDVPPPPPPPAPTAVPPPPPPPVQPPAPVVPQPVVPQPTIARVAGER